MKITRIKRISLRNIPIVVFLLLITNKWLFEGIIYQPFCEVVILLMGLTYGALKNAIRIQKASMIWLLYCFSILLNVLISGSSLSVWGRALIMVCITIYAVMYGPQKYNFQIFTKWLIRISVFHAIMVIVHCILGEKFNSAYFPHLPAALQEVSESYFRKGYRFGILYAPHEVAGILSFAVVAIILSLFVYKRKNVNQIFCVIFLMLPIFLSAKKGVVIISFVMLFFAIMILYGSKKQWKRVFKVLIIGIMILAGGAIYIFTHQDTLLFARFAQFFTGLSTGQAIDSGRGPLYAYAITDWMNNKMFGIGWGQFTGKTVSMYGYATGHQVNFDYLQWLCEMGIVGFVLNLIPVLTTLYQTVYISKNVLRKIKDNTEKLQVLFAIFVQFFTLIYAFIEVPFYDIYFFGMYMISSVIINVAYQNRRRYCVNK